MPLPGILGDEYSFDGGREGRIGLPSFLLEKDCQVTGLRRHINHCLT